MAENLHIPGVGPLRVEAPNPVAVQIAQALGPILQAISNQLDLLIQLECGHLHSAEMRRRFEDFEAKRDAAQMMQERSEHDGHQGQAGE